MNILVDSWAWLELFKGGPKAQRIISEIAGAEEVKTTPINVYEVGRRITREHGEKAALEHMRKILQKAEVVSIGVADAYDALLLGEYEKLHTADAFTFALAAKNGCTLLTGDPHFRGKKGVRYVGD